jgi:arsenical pump membrane protein
MHILLGISIFAGTLALIMLRPRGITEASAALGGAALMLLAGLVSPADAAAVLAQQWNVYGFFLGLMVIAALADRAGVFEWLAYRAGRMANGSALRLYVAIFAVGTLITTFQSNDATALILTPIVFALVTRLGLPVLPFVFACTFIADTASFVLPVSNPVNILVLDVFGEGLGPFLRYLLLPSLICIVLNTLVFTWIFRHELRRTYDPSDLYPGRQRDPRFFRFALGALLAIGAAYVVAALARLPLSLVALGGAATLAAGALRCGQLESSHLRGEISWSLFAFITGMFVVVRGVDNLGLTAAFGSALLRLAGDNPLQAALVAAGGTTIGANMINNVPMTLVMISALSSIHASPLIHDMMVYGTIFGAALGPNLTTVGSLATILWIVILRRKGLEISPRTYIRLGVTVVPVMIVLGAFFIALQA